MSAPQPVPDPRPGPRPGPGALSRARREADLDHVTGETVDLLVVGLGVTGAGVALDAASRGLSVLAVDAHDLAFGTSRWSSKLVHGGLRYLAKGQLGVAHESAVERGILMGRTAPHLTRAMPLLVPLTDAVPRRQGVLAMQGFRAGDALRAAAGTPRSLLPGPRRLSAQQTRALVPPVRTQGLRGGLLSHDGQLEDDARLVVALARTAAAYGARVVTRARALDVTADGATLRDELTGRTVQVRCRAVVNAAGVWAGQVVDGLTLRPSRGTHLVLRGDRLAGVDVAVSAPVPGSLNRFVFTLPQADGLVYVGLTDEPAPDEVPDVPEATEAEVDFLLETMSSAFEAPLTRADVVGTYAGLRPLLAAEGSTADLSRKHAVLTSDAGVVTVVGGKLTTYRRMAEDAVGAVVAGRGLTAQPCRTRDLPLVGAATRPQLARVDAPARLVRRYGAEAPRVLADAVARTGLDEAALLESVAEGVPVTRAELLWGVTHEGAVDADDLLDRRTRVGMVADDRAATEDAARWALEH
ncbi:glycerol-3-phosphate dehydrogenase/oxidase [Nocardioides sp. HDW12B]|uniref:glycerol-3-phosphate dehydrogenase/oxidase n=1 Tax=Nocardioides sp. HDW12B TaxID=2714939 RepID=UPI00140A2C53|nr:glycerol-3-phosphate dehydrogenase/oxidase [Nocardioides sp. HDW12B]QIK67813.1 glycerol-3-phosphate dehydrogenase/oxidase [Nocardioides sp. HDW12B]